METYYDYYSLHDITPTVRPRLMIDRLAVDPDNALARAVKAVTMDEQIFLGHFPGNPIFPGVLQLASMLQTAKGFIGHRDGLDAAADASLAAAQRIKFRAPVYPGDRLETEAIIEDEDDEKLIAKCSTAVAGRKTCEGVLTIQKKRPVNVDLGQDLFAPPLHDFEGKGTQEPVDINAIMSHIPHRYPFLFIDRVLMMDPSAHRIVALKNVTGNEPFFHGHSPAVLPSYVHAEIAAQAGCALALSEPGNENKLAFFMSIDSCNFYHPVVPGDQLLLDVQVEPRGRFGKGHGQMYVGETMVSDIDLKFAIVDRED